MKWTVPGTCIQIDPREADRIGEVFSSMFLAGGIQLSQVCAITQLEGHAVQNWVKRGFLAAPVKKQYDLEQLCRVITINMLRPALSLEQISGLLQYINGDPLRSDDDLIGDSTLYFLFVRLAAQSREFPDVQQCQEQLELALKDYQEPVSGAKERVENVLKVMLTAWAASQLRLAAQKMTTQLFE